MISSLGRGGCVGGVGRGRGRWWGMSLAAHDLQQPEHTVGDEDEQERVAEERRRRIRLHVGVCARQTGHYGRSDQHHYRPNDVDNQLLF